MRKGRRAPVRRQLGCSATKPALVGAAAVVLCTVAGVLVGTWENPLPAVPLAVQLAVGTPLLAASYALWLKGYSRVVLRRGTRPLVAPTVTLAFISVAQSLGATAWTEIAVGVAAVWLPVALAGLPGEGLRRA